MAHEAMDRVKDFVESLAHRAEQARAKDPLEDTSAPPGTQPKDSQDTVHRSPRPAAALPQQQQQKHQDDPTGSSPGSRCGGSDDATGGSPGSRRSSSGGNDDGEHITSGAAAEDDAVATVTVASGSGTGDNGAVVSDGVASGTEADSVSVNGAGTDHISGAKERASRSPTSAEKGSGNTSSGSTPSASSTSTLTQTPSASSAGASPTPTSTPSAGSTSTPSAATPSAAAGGVFDRRYHEAHAASRGTRCAHRGRCVPRTVNGSRAKYVCSHWMCDGMPMCEACFIDVHLHALQSLPPIPPHADNHGTKAAKAARAKWLQHPSPAHTPEKGRRPLIEVLFSKDIQETYFSPVWEEIRKLLQRRDETVQSMVADRVAKKDLSAHVLDEDLGDASKVAQVTVPDTVAPNKSSKRSHGDSPNERQRGRSSANNSAKRKQGDSPIERQRGRNSANVSGDSMSDDDSGDGDGDGDGGGDANGEARVEKAPIRKPKRGRRWNKTLKRAGAPKRKPQSKYSTPCESIFGFVKKSSGPGSLAPLELEMEMPAQPQPQPQTSPQPQSPLQPQLQAQPQAATLPQEATIGSALSAASATAGSLPRAILSGVQPPLSSPSHSLSHSMPMMPQPMMPTTPRSNGSGPRIGQTRLADIGPPQSLSSASASAAAVHGYETPTGALPTVGMPPPRRPLDNGKKCPVATPTPTPMELDEGDTPLASLISNTAAQKGAIASPSREPAAAASSESATMTSATSANKRRSEAAGIDSGPVCGAEENEAPSNANSSPGALNTKRRRIVVSGSKPVFDSHGVEIGETLYCSAQAVPPDAEAEARGDQAPKRAGLPKPKAAPKRGGLPNLAFVDDLSVGSSAGASESDTDGSEPPLAVAAAKGAAGAQQPPTASMLPEIDEGTAKRASVFGGYTSYTKMSKRMREQRATKTPTPVVYAPNAVNPPNIEAPAQGTVLNPAAQAAAYPHVPAHPLTATHAGPRQNPYAVAASAVPVAALPPAASDRVVVKREPGTHVSGTESDTTSSASAAAPSLSSALLRSLMQKQDAPPSAVDTRARVNPIAPPPPPPPPHGMTGVHMHTPMAMGQRQAVQGKALPTPKPLPLPKLRRASFPMAAALGHAQRPAAALGHAQRPAAALGHAQRPAAYPPPPAVIRSTAAPSNPITPDSVVPLSEERMSLVEATQAQGPGNTSIHALRYRLRMQRQLQNAEVSSSSNAPRQSEHGPMPPEAQSRVPTQEEVGMRVPTQEEVALRNHVSNRMSMNKFIRSEAFAELSSTQISNIARLRRSNTVLIHEMLQQQMAAEPDSDEEQPSADDAHAQFTSSSSSSSSQPLMPSASSSKKPIDSSDLSYVAFPPPPPPPPQAAGPVAASAPPPPLFNSRSGMPVRKPMYAHSVNFGEDDGREELVVAGVVDTPKAAEPPSQSPYSTRSRMQSPNSTRSTMQSPYSTRSTMQSPYSTRSAAQSPYSTRRSAMQSPNSTRSALSSSSSSSIDVGALSSAWRRPTDATRTKKRATPTRRRSDEFMSAAAAAASAAAASTTPSPGKKRKRSPVRRRSDGSMPTAAAAASSTTPRKKRNRSPKQAASCHQCKKSFEWGEMWHCNNPAVGYGMARACHKKYCDLCVGLQVQHEGNDINTVAAMKENRHFGWVCAACRGTCRCAKCSRIRQNRDDAANPLQG